MLHAVRISHGAANGLLVMLLGTLSVGCSLKAASKATTLSLVLPNSSSRLAQMGGAPRNGIVVPSAWNSGSFACYGVNVIGPGIADTGIAPSASQFSNFSALVAGTTGCSYRGVVSNTVSLAAPGGSTTIDLQVPSGPGRIIQLVGITDAANCGANFLNPADPVNSAALLIGSVSADLLGDTTVSIPITYSSSSPKRVDCLYGSAVTVLPVVAMDTHSNGYINYVDSTGGTDFTGICSESGQVVTLSLGGSTIGSATCGVGLSWTISVTSTTLATIAEATAATFMLSTVSASGVAGNPVSVILTKDTIAPVSPTGVSLSGVTSPSNLNDISVQVIGVSTGDIVKLYSAPGCTGTVRGSAIATGTSATLAISLPSDGSYDFYPKVVDPAGNAVCGTNYASYLLDTAIPVVTISGISPYSGVSYTGSSSVFESAVNIAATASEAISAHCIQETGLGSCTTWTTGTTLPTYADFSVGSSRNVALDVWVKDVAGNVSAKVTSSTIAYDNSCDTMSGIGSVGTPYLIDTATRFAECIPLLDAPATYFKLASDISLSGFHTVMPEFYGQLDGDSHALSGLVRSAGPTEVGLFSGFINGAVVKNLDITSASVTCLGAGSGCGILGGSAIGSVLIQNVSLSGSNTISTNGYSDVGGLVGYAEGEVHFISNKVFGLNISSTAAVATGNIGGIVGHFAKAAANTSDVDFYRNRISSSQITSGQCKNSTGGLVGTVNTLSAGVNIKFNQNSVNFGLPCMTSTATRVGGMIGFINNGASLSAYTVEVKNSNVKSVISSSLNASYLYYGGIVGLVGVVTDSAVSVVSSIFAGTINMSDTSYAGTIIGASSATASVGIANSRWVSGSNVSSAASAGAYPIVTTLSATDTDVNLALSANYQNGTDWADSTIWTFDGTNLPKLWNVDL